MIGQWHCGGKSLEVAEQEAKESELRVNERLAQAPLPQAPLPSSPLCSLDMPTVEAERIPGRVNQLGGPRHLHLSPTAPCTSLKSPCSFQLAFRNPFFLSMLRVYSLESPPGIHPIFSSGLFLSPASTSTLFLLLCYTAVLDILADPLLSWNAATCNTWGMSVL